MRKKDKKITEQDVFRILVDASLTLNGTISIVNIASLLGSSDYQVKEHIDILVEKGYVEKKMICTNMDSPYYVYYLTDEVVNGDGEVHEAYNKAFMNHMKNFSDLIKS